MNLDKFWKKALQNTEIIRSRVQALMTTGDTMVPYIILSESSINVGDTVVRKGEVLVKRPALYVPPNNPQFSGFDFDSDLPVNENLLVNFLLVRGISLPSLRYDNKTLSMDIYEGKMSLAIKHYKDMLAREENVHTGLVAGPEDCWQFSLLIFICSQIIRNADADIKRLLDDYRKKHGGDR